MTHLPVYTAYAASILMIIQMTLMLMVGLSRGKHEQSIGDGGHEALLLAIRRHANLTENAPIFLITLGLLELVIGNTLMVMILAIGFVVARILHAIGLSIGADANAARAIGALGTLGFSLTAAGYLLWSLAF